MRSSTRGRAGAPKVCAHSALEHPGARKNTSPRASDQERAAAPILDGYASPMNPRTESPNTVVSSAAGEYAHPRVLAEELMQRTRHHREVGHLGCVIRNTLEESKGDRKGGGGGEE